MHRLQGTPEPEHCGACTPARSRNFSRVHRESGMTTHWRACQIQHARAHHHQRKCSKSSAELGQVEAASVFGRRGQEMGHTHTHTCKNIKWGQTSQETTIRDLTPLQMEGGLAKATRGCVREEKKMGAEVQRSGGPAMTLHPHRLHTIFWIGPWLVGPSGNHCRVPAFSLKRRRRALQLGIGEGAS